MDVAPNNSSCKHAPLHTGISTCSAVAHTVSVAFGENAILRRCPDGAASTPPTCSRAANAATARVYMMDE